MSGSDACSPEATLSKAYDLVVRGAVVVDGTGGAPFEADVAVKDGRVAAVGRVAQAGAEEIDARGKIVTPGFVDIHTHYDGQATWGDRMQPSSFHGVTTVVMGNCGVGFAPCRPEDHDRLVRLMEGVEDIPFPGPRGGPAVEVGELSRLSRRARPAALRRRPRHAAAPRGAPGLRDGRARREPRSATAADIAAMAAIAERAVEAGALGFSTSRTLNHRTSDGQPTPTLTAGEDELTGIALGLARAAGERASGCCSSCRTSRTPRRSSPCCGGSSSARGGRCRSRWSSTRALPGSGRRMLDRLSEATAGGLPMKAQVCGRPVGVLFGLELTHNPFSHHPSYSEIARLPLADRVRRLQDPDFRARLLSETTTATTSFAANMARYWPTLFLMGEAPDYEQPPERTVAALAPSAGSRRAASPSITCCSNDGRGMLYLPFLNYVEGLARSRLRDDDPPGHPARPLRRRRPRRHDLRRQLPHLEPVPLDARPHARDPGSPSQQVVRMQTRRRRGRSASSTAASSPPGYRADLNVIDYDRLDSRRPRWRTTCPPAGGGCSSGPVATWPRSCAGEVTYRDGEPTSALPGRLVRGGQPGPSRGGSDESQERRPS